MRTYKKTPWQKLQVLKITRMVKASNRLGRQFQRSNKESLSASLFQAAKILGQALKQVEALPADYRPTFHGARGRRFNVGDEVLVKPAQRKGFSFQNPIDVDYPLTILVVLGHRLKVESISGETTMLGSNQVVPVEE